MRSLAKYQTLHIVKMIFLSYNIKEQTQQSDSEHFDLWT